MESQIEKMYSNANIKICKRKQGFTLKDCTDRDCKECGYYDMPPFIAEKQLELIKWLVHYIKQINITDAISGEFYFTAFGYVGYLKVDFDEALASFINNLWQDLTDAEKAQIRGILE